MALVNALGDVVYDPTDGESNSPRSVIIIDGDRYIPLNWTATINAHGATNDAKIVLDVSGNPDFSAALYRDPANNSNAPVYAEIWAGFPTNPTPGSLDISQMKRRFLGLVDLYTVKFRADRVEFSCRSLAASLIDNHMTAATGALTSVQFLQQQVALLGLSANIQLPPGYQPITLREVYARQFEGGANFQAEIRKKKIWDVLLECAQFDGVDVWESPDQPVINYARPELVNRTNCGLQYGANIEECEGTHSIEFNRNIVVKVFTFQKRTRTSTTVRIASQPGGGTVSKVTTRTSTSTPIFGTTESLSTSQNPDGSTTYSYGSSEGGSGNSTSGEAAGESGKQVYKIYAGNLAPDKAQILGDSKWREISMMEYAISLPKQAMTRFLLQNLSITSLIYCDGLPYVFFNTSTLGKKYWPRELLETFDPASGGWAVAAKAVNHVLPNGSV